MLLKITDKELSQAAFVFTAGYCELQELLKYEEPLACARGRLGWRYDVYKIQDVYITTGYDRPRGCNMEIPLAIREEYTKKLTAARIDEAVYFLCLVEFARALRDWAVNFNRITREGTK